MNWDRVEGNWKQVTGRVKEKWAAFRSGTASPEDEAERQIKEWADRM